MAPRGHGGVPPELGAAVGVPELRLASLAVALHWDRLDQQKKVRGVKKQLSERNIVACGKRLSREGPTRGRELSEVDKRGGARSPAFEVSPFSGSVRNRPRGSGGACSSQE